MKPHPRIRTTTLWSGAFITLLIIALWILSAFYTVRWCPARDKLMFISSSGGFQMWYVRDRAWNTGPGFSIEPRSGPWINTASYAYHSPVFDYFILPFWVPFPLTIPPILIALFFQRTARRRAIIASGSCPDCRAPRAASPALCPSCCSDPVWGRRSFPRLRWTFKWLAAPTAALLITLWIFCSFWNISYRTASGNTTIATSRGGVMYDSSSFPIRWRGLPSGFLIEKTSRYLLSPPPRLPAPHYQRFMGDLSILIPFWLPTIPLALAGTTAWILDPISKRRERARARTHCIKCRYPLAGLPANAKCPECGTPANP